MMDVGVDAAEDSGGELPADVDAVDVGVDVVVDDVAADSGEDTVEDVVEDTVEDVAPLDPEACNGHRELCGRPYDEVAYATTHNAFSNEAEGWIAPNQLLPMPRQLRDGVRGLMLDFHYNEGEAHLCHGTCLAGKKPLAEGLGEITAFLEARPREVVTLILEVYVEPEDVEAAMSESGLIDYVYVHDGAAGWPTLEAMIEANTRVVLLTDDGGGTFGWYHDVWDYAVETPFSVRRPESFEMGEDYGCSSNRGSLANELFILNHFLTNPFADPDSAELVNYNPLLLDRARACGEAFGQLPNFVTVDFYSIGDVLEVVDELNGVGGE